MASRYDTLEAKIERLESTFGSFTQKIEARRHQLSALYVQQFSQAIKLSFSLCKTAKEAHQVVEPLVPLYAVHVYDADPEQIHAIVHKYKRRITGDYSDPSFKFSMALCDAMIYEEYEAHILTSLRIACTGHTLSHR